MEVDATGLDVRRAYALMTALVVPRPIGWIATPREQGGINLAPFSYFQALCSDPPMVTVSIADGRGGRPKDTLRLLTASSVFVAHLVEEHDLERMNQTSAELGPDVSEAEAFGIDVVPFFGVGRVASARAALGCRVVELHRYGRASMVTLVVAAVERVFLDDAIVDNDGAVIGERLSPVARLDGPHYALGGRRVVVARPPRPAAT